jgi:transposase
VLIIDNASFYHSDLIKTLCADVGLKLLYLPPYSPNFNPIKEFFAELIV